MTKLEEIVWFENHYPLWAATPATFGVTAGQCASVMTATKAARTSYDAAQAARLAAKNATNLQDGNIKSMNTVGRATVAIIKAFIENSGNPALWGQAGIDPPSPRGATPPPNAPTALSATLDSEGNLLVKWKATQPQGVSSVVYFIRRALDGGDYTLQDTVGEKKWTDENVPSGTRTVSYIIVAKHGGQSSVPSDALTLRFGREGGGLTIASSVVTPTATSGPTKLAA